MRKIDELLHYNLGTPGLINLLISNEIINGCGSHKFIIFDRIIMLLSRNKRLINTLFIQYLSDVRMLCFQHDLDWVFQKGFIKSNYNFAMNIAKLTSWGGLITQTLLFINVFILLLFGYNYYKEAKILQPKLIEIWKEA